MGEASVLASVDTDDLPRHRRLPTALARIG